MDDNDDDLDMFVVFFLRPEGQAGSLNDSKLRIATFWDLVRLSLNNTNDLEFIRLICEIHAPAGLLQER